MNGYQRFTAVLAIIIITLSSIYPPWEYTFQDQGISQVTKPAGYHLIFLPPEPESSYENYGVRIDFDRYLIQIIGISILFGGFFFISKKQD